jgi:hypothetical protein
MAFLNGYEGDLQFTPSGGSATILECKEFTINLSRDEQDVTNKQSSGAQQIELGIWRLDCNFTALWDGSLAGSNVPPYPIVYPQEGVAYNLQVGNPSPTSAAGNGGSSVFSGNGTLTKLEITSATDKKIEYKGTLKSSGPITHTINTVN